MFNSGFSYLNFIITGYQEKPTIDYSVSMGIYVFEPEVLQFIAKGQNLDFPDLVKIMLAAGKKDCAFPFTGYGQDPGYPDDRKQANADIEQMRSQFLPEEHLWNGEAI